MKSKMRLISCLGPLFILMFVLGCGYSMKSLYDQSYSTIAVPIFKNKTFYREYEFRLTEAVIKEIETRTPYKVVNRSEADTLLTGEIVSIQQPVLTEDVLDRVAEFQYSVTVQVRWKDQKTGRILLDAPFTKRAEADVRRGENLQSASQEALADLAEVVVEALEKKW